MKERTIIISIFILLMCSLCACTIHNDKEIDEERDKYGIRGRDMIPGGHYCDHDHDGYDDGIQE